MATDPVMEQYLNDPNFVPPASKSDKEYHFGVIAHWDDEHQRWSFHARPINGDDSPFADMGDEIYNYATDQWENASPDSYSSVATANEETLYEVIDAANHLLKGDT
jgi:hypothetical protein